MNSGSKRPEFIASEISNTEQPSFAAATALSMADLPELCGKWGVIAFPNIPSRCLMHSMHSILIYKVNPN